MTSSAETRRAIARSGVGARLDKGVGSPQKLHCQSYAGQPGPYLAKLLNDYRRGVRRHDMMTLVVQPLTDQDVADLAAYYAAIEVNVKPPP